MRHDWTCGPWNAPYGVEWLCGRCGAVVRQSFITLADPERLHSTAAALQEPCPSTRRRSQP